MSIPETRVYVTEPGFTSRLAWAQLLASFRGWQLVPLAAVYAALGYSVVSLGDGWAGRAMVLAALLFSVAVAVGLLFLAMRRQAARTAPAGSRYAVALGDHSMEVAVGPVSSEVPYSTYSRVRRRGAFVLLRFRTSAHSLVLPAELFPADDFDRLVAAVADPAAAPAAQALPGGTAAGFEHAYVTDAGFVGRLARSVTARLFLRGPMVVMLGLLAGIGIVLLLVSLLGLLLAATGNVSVAEATPVLGGAAFVLGFAALLVLLSYALIRLQLRRAIPVGSIYELGFGADALRMRGPVNSSEMPYSTYRRARRRGQFVEIAGRRGVARVTLPAQLFPGTGLERLNALLQKG